MEKVRERGYYNVTTIYGRNYIMLFEDNCWKAPWTDEICLDDDLSFVDEKRIDDVSKIDDEFLFDDAKHMKNYIIKKNIEDKYIVNKWNSLEDRDCTFTEFYMSQIDDPDDSNMEFLLNFEWDD